MNHIMLDLETMGTKPNAAIVSIGAVFIDFENNTLGDEFYRRICLESSVQCGGVMDAQTVKWWMQQHELARREIYTATATMNKSLEAFMSFISAKVATKNVKIWGDGASFDNVILRSAYENCGLIAPWKYWNDRCYRTIKNIYPDVKERQSGQVHNALDDAISQANNLLAIVKKHNLVGSL
jgi:exodeoxyribonuclease VIII